MLPHIKKFWGKGDGGLGEGEKALLEKGLFPFPQHLPPSSRPL